MVKTEEIILNDLKQAMRQRERLKLSVLRLLVAAVTNARIAKNQNLTEEELQRVLNQEVKKRQEAIALFKRGNRPELAEKEALEIEIIKTYLPKMMSESEIRRLVQAMQAAGELSDNFGQAMKQVMAKVAGKAEGKLVATVVQSEL